MFSSMSEFGSNLVSLSSNTKNWMQLANNTIDNKKTPDLFILVVEIEQKQSVLPYAVPSFYFVMLSKGWFYSLGDEPEQQSHAWSQGMLSSSKTCAGTVIKFSSARRALPCMLCHQRVGYCATRLQALKWG